MITINRRTFFRYQNRGIGTIIILALVVLFLLFSFGMMYMYFMSGERQLTHGLYEIERMRYIAEAGADEATLHIRKTMNKESEKWHETLRKPVNDLMVDELVSRIEPEEIVPPFTNNLLKKVFPSDSTVQCKVTIKLAGISEFDKDPVRDGVEKQAVFVITSAVKTKDRTLNLEIMREVKVVRVSPPPPLDKYTLWLWDKGKLDKAKNINKGEVTPLDPLPAPDSDMMTNGWQYTWHKKERKYFPAGCIKKISYFFVNKSEFMKHFRTPDGYHLDGITLFEPKDEGTLNLSGKMNGRGLLLLENCKLDLGYLDTAADSLPGLAVLGENRIVRLSGYGNRTFRGILMVPEGYLDTDPNLSLKGFVYARGWNFTLQNSLKFDDTKLAAPVYQVTMTEQIVKWKEYK